MTSPGSPPQDQTEEPLSVRPAGATRPSALCTPPADWTGSNGDYDRAGDWGGHIAKDHMHSPRGEEWRDCRESTATGPRRSPNDLTVSTARTPATSADIKRHSWAARQQHEVIPEELPVTRCPTINRALSLDSAFYSRYQRTNLTTSGRGDGGHSNPLMRNGHGSPGFRQETDALPQKQAFPTNGELHYSEDMVPEIADPMDISHDPNVELDQAKFITHRAHGSRRTGRRNDGCCGCGSHYNSPCCSTCCKPVQNFCTNLFKHGNCSCKEKSDESDADDDIFMEDDPFRKRCLRAFLNFVYVLLAFIAVIVTYSMIQDLITAMNNPVRSIHYKKLKDYEAPGISMYPGGAKFLACGHYYNNVVTSKVRTSDLDLVNRNCTYTRLNYDDPHYIGVRRDVLVVRGPTSFEKREAIFLHFELEDETRDFFTVSYFVFPGWDKFNASTVPQQIDQLTEYHRYMPTFALSSGLRMWIKLIMSETYLMDDTKHTEFRVEKEEAKHTEFNVEYSVVKFWDRRPEHVRKKHLFFIFFEWKNNIVEQSYLIYTTTPWSIGAGLCGVFLTLHRGYQLAQIGYKRARKDKERRSIRKRTIRELKKAKSMERRDVGSQGTVNRKLRQQLSS